MISDGVEDEDKWLASGIAGLQQNAFYMHRALVIPLSLSLTRLPSILSFSLSIHIHIDAYTSFYVK
ncbi:hypothetical protein C3L33_17803, partial [Rhododendron williamsianum]